MEWYNGYSPNERAAMGRAIAPSKAMAPPCANCGDRKLRLLAPLRMLLERTINRKGMT
jgi:hypothetical protein